MAKILVVDDSGADRRIVVNALPGHAIVEATNGEEALLRARESHPDLILMDVVMPGKNGYETCRELKRTPATSGIPVILISTKSLPTDKDWAVRQGADAYLTKPFDDRELVTLVERFVGETGGA